MANNRLIRLMQEALDENLSPEQYEELNGHLNTDDVAARAFDAQRRVDSMLRSAPHARAPERLAVTIMARIAQSVAEQAEMQDMPDESRQALMLSLVLVMLATMPVLLAASWLVMNALSDPELITSVINQIIALLAMILEAVQVLLEKAAELARTHPELAAVALTLVLMVLLGMLEYLEDRDE